MFTKAKKLNREEIKNVTCGALIRRYRDKKCFSQEYLATQLGISQSTYQRIESGIISVSHSRLEKIADILEQPINALIHEDMNYEEGYIMIKLERLVRLETIISEQAKSIVELNKKLVSFNAEVSIARDK